MKIKQRTFERYLPYYDVNGSWKTKFEGFFDVLKFCLQSPQYTSSQQAQLAAVLWRLGATFEDDCIGPRSQPAFFLQVFPRYQDLWPFTNGSSRLPVPSKKCITLLKFTNVKALPQLCPRSLHWLQFADIIYLVMLFLLW